LAEKQKQRLGRRRNAVALVLGIAIGAKQRQLAVARQRDLGPGIAALLDMLADQPIEVFERF